MTKPPKKSPCGSCPYRRDVPSGVWHESEYEKLPLYDKPLLSQPPGVFECHQQDGHLCSGWVGTHDMMNNLALKINYQGGHMTDDDLIEVLDYTTTVPLFDSGQEACEHGMAKYEAPDERATRIQNKLLKKPGVTKG